MLQKTDDARKAQLTHRIATLEERREAHRESWMALKPAAREMSEKDLNAAIDSATSLEAAVSEMEGSPRSSAASRGVSDASATNAALRAQRDMLTARMGAPPPAATASDPSSGASEAELEADNARLRAQVEELWRRMAERNAQAAVEGAESASRLDAKRRERDRLHAEVEEITRLIDDLDNADDGAAAVDPTAVTAEIGTLKDDLAALRDELLERRTSNLARSLDPTAARLAAERASLRSELQALTALRDAPLPGDGVASAPTADDVAAAEADLAKLRSDIESMQALIGERTGAYIANATGLGTNVRLMAFTNEKILLEAEMDELRRQYDAMPEPPHLDTDGPAGSGEDPNVALRQQVLNFRAVLARRIGVHNTTWTIGEQGVVWEAERLALEAELAELEAIQAKVPEGDGGSATEWPGDDPNAELRARVQALRTAVAEGEGRRLGRTASLSQRALEIAAQSERTALEAEASELEALVKDLEESASAVAITRVDTGGGESASTPTAMGAGAEVSFDANVDLKDRVAELRREVSRQEGLVLARRGNVAAKTQSILLENERLTLETEISELTRVLSELRTSAAASAGGSSSSSGGLSSAATAGDDINNSLREEVAALRTQLYEEEARATQRQAEVMKRRLEEQSLTAQLASLKEGLSKVWIWGKGGGGRGDLFVHPHLVGKQPISQAPWLRIHFVIHTHTYSLTLKRTRAQFLHI